MLDMRIMKVLISSAMLVAPADFASAQSATRSENGGAAPLVHDGGVCAGLSWIRLLPAEHVRVEDGPDFMVLRFEGPQGLEWGVYSGNHAQVRGNGPLLLRRDGVIIHRAFEGGEFRGYLAEKGSWQNHFFGTVFTGADRDRVFFDRVDFSARGQSLCARRTGSP